MRRFLYLAAMSFLACAAVPSAAAFVAQSSGTSSRPTTSTRMVPMEMVSTLEQTTALASSLTIAETQAWVQPTAAVLDPLLNFFCLAMLARVVLSWYPETKVTEMPWILLVIPTQPLLKAVKGVIPPAFGVDISPIFYIAVFSFIHEILLGQQGLLTMKIKYGI